MTTLKPLLAILLVVLHLGAGFDLIVAHNHLFCVEANSSTRLEAHTCGANEIHKPIDQDHHCLLCLRTSGSFAVLAFFSTPPKARVQALVHRASRPPSLKGLHLSERDRGPPLPCS